MVFDGLAAYNRARARDATRGVVGVSSFDFGADSRDGGSRKRWFQRLSKSMAGLLPEQVTILSYEDINGLELLAVWRRVLVCFETDIKFRKDVEEAADLHFKRGGISPSELDLRLSRLYILEEIAANVQIRVGSALQDEYYLGTFHEPLLRLYSGWYNFCIDDLAGVKTSITDFRFFSWGCGAWQLVRAEE